MDYPLLRQDKGSPLSHEEMDDNWMRSSVQLGNWKSDYFYSVNALAAYNGVIYKSLAPNLNKSPAVHPAEWSVWTSPHTHVFADIEAATDDDATMAANSHTRIPTQWAVKQYVASQIGTVSYTDEQAKDAVGGALTNSNSINFTYSGAPGRTINADVRLDGGSLTISIDGIKISDAGVSSAMIQDGAIQNSHIGDSVIAEAKLDIFNNPSNGWAILWSDAEAKMVWTDLTPLLYIDAMAVDAVAAVLIPGPGINIDLSNPQSGITISLNAAAAPANYSLKLSDDTTALEVSATPIDTFYVPFDMQVSVLAASLTAASTAGDVVLELYRNGSPILTTPITVEVGEESSLTATDQPVAVSGELDWEQGDKIEIFLTSAGDEAAGLKLNIGYASTLIVSDAVGQIPLQFQDEASDLGIAGNVATINFEGNGVEAARSGATVTVTIPGDRGLKWEIISSADTSLDDQTGYVLLTGGTLREATLPASVTVPFAMRVVAVGGQVRVVSNGNMIQNVGAGNDLLLDAGEMVELVATSSGTLEITDFSSLP